MFNIIKCTRIFKRVEANHTIINLPTTIFLSVYIKPTFKKKEKRNVEIPVHRTKTLPNLWFQKKLQREIL